MSRRTTLPALALLATLSVAACSSPGAEGPQATPPPEESATDSGTAIEEPRDISTVTDACTLLTEEQLSGLGGAGSTPAVEESEYGQPKCRWSNDNYSVSVALFDGGGADVIFTKPDINRVDVGGYPAGHRPGNDRLCRVEVLVAEYQQIDVSYSRYGGETPELKDTCGMAQKLATEAVKNLPAASS
ncbi:DUF3558 domain-containing protein [Saccharopolyspora cebuensis]|uniref:DUF3558 domain-containing protein n=1 Tax=Saccharopolyspora cebuensis TaxID=418759 RepID=A0ABV4CK24_9PSEU